MSVIIGCNKLDLEIQNARSLCIFKTSISKFMRPTANNTIGCHNLKGVKYLIRLRLGFSHLHENKFKNYSQDTLNPLCTSGCDVEIKCYFLLDCRHFFTERNTLLIKTTNFDSNISNQADAIITKTLLLGNSKYSNKVNLQTANASIDFVPTSKRFDKPHLNF